MALLIITSGISLQLFCYIKDTEDINKNNEVQYHKQFRDFLQVRCKLTPQHTHNLHLQAKKLVNPMEIYHLVCLSLDIKPALRRPNVQGGFGKSV